MADDDDAVRAKLAALDAQVRAEGDAQRVRKEAALAKIREQRAEQQELRERQALVVAKKKPAPREAREPYDEADANAGLGSALELATKANRVKNELARKPKKGEKSWIVSGVASAALGPLGWLYAGSLRETIPAAAAWVLLATIASKILPVMLLWPVLFVALPLSGIAGIVYALQYNRHGGRRRLWTEEKPKELAGGGG